MYLSVTLLGLLYECKKCFTINIITMGRVSNSFGVLCMCVFVLLLGDFRDRDRSSYQCNLNILWLPITIRTQFKVLTALLSEILLEPDSCLLFFSSSPTSHPFVPLLGSTGLQLVLGNSKYTLVLGPLPLFLSLPDGRIPGFQLKYYVI